MSKFCEFCQMEHTSNSCFHPGAAKLRAAAYHIKELERELEIEVAIRREMKVGEALSAKQYHIMLNKYERAFTRAEELQRKYDALVVGLDDKIKDMACTDDGHTPAKDWCGELRALLEDDDE